MGRSCKCRVVLGFEECAIMGHLVRYKEFAAWVEEGGEGGGDGVQVCKVVVGLRALGRGRDENKQREATSKLEVRRDEKRRTTMISNLSPPSSPG